MDRDRKTLKGLSDEVGHDPTVVDTHSGSVGVEDPGNADIQAVPPVIGRGEGLGESLRLVVDRADADGVYVAPVAFGLGVDEGFAVDLAGRCLKKGRSVTLGNVQEVRHSSAAHV